MYRKAHHNLISFALAAGHTVAVDHTDYVEVPKQGLRAIIAEAEAADECQLIVIDQSGKRLDVFYVVIDSSFEPDEYVADYTRGAFAREWEAQFISK